MLFTVVNKQVVVLSFVGYPFYTFVHYLHSPYIFDRSSQILYIVIFISLYQYFTKVCRENSKNDVRKGLSFILKDERIIKSQRKNHVGPLELFFSNIKKKDKQSKEGTPRLICTFLYPRCPPLEHYYTYPYLLHHHITCITNN